ncbi:TniQ family protein [Pseudarthrobacter sp. SSS035]|uniref:TniQ family protein n=1 Tax=Pseudarthrobacter sp. SSS035 TaxID=2931399 RepID=UPI002010AD9C|nr:TniQ family protein [Pseudarthrobacter sp. SSS035]
MIVSRRWPVHPAPLPVEALSSWLRRIAVHYHANLDDLASDLGYALDGPEEIDTYPPPGFTRELARRTGLDLHRIQRMSLSGWAPWLIDQAEPDAAAFTTYTRQFSVLLPAGRRRPRELPTWQAWLPSGPAFRACPKCIATSTPPYPYQLLWLLSLTLSCPFHRCLLEPRAKTVSYFSDWERKPPTPRLASATVLAMDSRTWHAMTTGSVDLPRRQVHAGIWFRLLRTIIDELGTSVSECRTAGRLIRRLWKESGYPHRVGPLRWHPHEGYPLDVQLRTLEATATTIHLLESKILAGQGPDAAFFLPSPSGSMEEL